MNFEIKVDDKLSIKIPNPEDAKDVYDVIDKDRPHLSEWLDWVKDTNSFRDTEKNISKRIEGFRDKKSASFLISYEGSWVGSVGFIEIEEEHKKGEIGYWLASSCGGKGVMTKCVEAVVNYGFNNLGLNRIVIKCDSNNIKSAKIPKKLGFELEGTLREDKLKNNAFSDTLIWGMLEKDWKTSKD